MADPQSNSIRAASPQFQPGPAVRQGIPRGGNENRLRDTVQMRDRDERAYLTKLGLALGMPVAGWEARSISEVRQLLLDHAMHMVTLDTKPETETETETETDTEDDAETAETEQEDAPRTRSGRRR